MNFIERVKLLPSGTRRLLSIGIIMALVVALPLFIWAIKGNYNLSKKAGSGEPGVCIPQNKVITVTPDSDLNGTCHSIQAAVDAVTGTGYTVQIEPGVYNVNTTINVADKDTINISGNPQAGSGAANIIFNISSGGWGFRVQNSTGTIEWLTASGFTPNGLLEVENSQGFTIAYSSLNATSSHTLGVSNSNYFNIYNTEIQSSAGALTISSTNNISIGNNKVHNSDNAFYIYDSQNLNIFGNLVYSNRERALEMSNITNLTATHNTFVNNGLNGNSFPAVDATQSMSGTFNISDNIIATNNGGGLKFAGTTSNLSGQFQKNDVYGNGENYTGIPNQTGINGNIASNPILDSANSRYCPTLGSPVIYGNVGNMEYMGYVGPCDGVSSPYPSPTASISPTPYPTPLPASECHMCGGIAGIYCASGLTCQMSGNYPDASGTCVKTNGTSNCGGSPSPSPTASPSPVPQILNFLIKFAGVAEGSADGAGVSATFQSPQGTYVTPPMTAHYVANGIYRISFIPSTPFPSTTLVQTNSGPKQGVLRYITSLKGEKHLKTKFCGNTGIITRCSQTVGSDEGLIIDPAGGTYDFTAFPLEPGDLHIQDGIANSSDFTKIKDLLNKPCANLTTTEKLTADLDYSGCVNVRDAFLMRQTLQTRYDEN